MGRDAARLRSNWSGLQERRELFVTEWLDQMRVETRVLAQLSVDELRPASRGDDHRLHGQILLSDASANFVAVHLGEPNI